MAGFDSVSVVVPVLNREKLIVRCLESIVSQTFPGDIHVIVVDNGSSDGTVGAVRSWWQALVNSQKKNRTLEMLTEPKPGAPSARNRGLETVKTEWMLFFDSDDEMHPGLLQDADDALGKGEYDMAVWRCEVVGLDGQRYLKPWSRRNLLKRQAYNSLLSTQAYMVRTSFMHRAGGWEESALEWNDWELGFRLVALKPRIAWIPKVEVTIHAQEKSITGTSYSSKAGKWEKVIDIIGRKASDRGDDQLPEMLDYCRAVLASHYRKEGRTDLADPLLAKASSAYSLPVRLWLRMLYRYTAAGGRGAYLLWK